MGNWKKISSRVAHQNPWYKIREDEVIRPNGSEGKYFVIDGIDCVSVIAKDDNDICYLVEQTRYPTGNRRSLELITGGITGRDILSAAKAELQEETGIIAGNWEKIGQFDIVDGCSSGQCHTYLATDLNFGENKHEATELEDLEVKKYKLDEIPELIRSGKIFDGISIAAFYQYQLSKEKK